MFLESVPTRMATMLCQTPCTEKGRTPQKHLYSRFVIAILSLTYAGAAAVADDIPEPRACTLTCPANIETTTESGKCSAVVFFPLPTTNGTCSPAQASGLTSGSDFPVGNTTITFVDQGSGANCQFSVTVRDGQPPVLTCPSPGSVAARIGSDCMAEVPDFRDLITTSDNCDNSNLYDSQTPPAGTKVPPGSTPITIKAKDQAGNTTTCIYDFNVNQGCGCGMCGVSAPMSLTLVGLTLVAGKQLRRLCHTQTHTHP